MASLDVPPAPEPRRSLSKLRRKGKDKNGDGNASASSLLPPQDEPSNGLRKSIDGAIDRLRERRRKSSGDRRSSTSESSSNPRLSSISLSRSLKARKKSDSGEKLDVSGPNDRGTVSRTPSELSLGPDGSGHSSLLTEDEDEAKPTRPSLTPHDSHKGYLTITSPLIKAQAANSTVSLDQTAASAKLHSPADSEKVSHTKTSRESPTAIEPRASPAERLNRLFANNPKRKPVGGNTQTAAVEPADADADTGPASGLGIGLGGDDKSEDKDIATPTRAASRSSFPQAKQDSLFSTPRFKTSPRPSIVTEPATPPNKTGSPTKADTPLTYVTPPTPTIDQGPPSPQKLPKTDTDAPGSGNSSPASLSSASAKRKRAANFTSSKLINQITSSPLSPHLEEAKTPGGTLTAPNINSVNSTSIPNGGAGGFFSSVFSAAQNAANQFTNSINTSINQNQKEKGRALKSEPSEGKGGEEVIPGPEDLSQTDESSGEKRQLAVETIGKGDLSLSHLGISEDPDVSPMTSQTDLHDITSQPPVFVHSPESTQQQVENDAAARAVSDAYEKPIQNAVSQATGGRPASVASAEGSEVGTPRTSINVDRKRAGSIRSRLSERQTRHRGSSAATGGTLTGALSVSSTALANAAAGDSSRRLTGFAVASSKRNKDFHQLFRSVPEDDYLIEDYSAALQRDILLHGRLYVSEGHICFSSNILGWVTNLVISFDEVVSVEKKSTAVIFPNAIVIQTLHARNVFASFVARDSTYDLLVGIWKISHPNLKSSLNGVILDDAGTGDKTEKAGSIASEEDLSASEDEVYDEDEDDDDAGSLAASAIDGGSIAGSDVPEGNIPVSRKASNVPFGGGSPANGGATKETETVTPSGGPTGVDFLGPTAHAPTECGDDVTHLDKPLTDTTIPAPLGKVYSLMWGAQSGTFMRKFLVDDQKSRELEMTVPPTGLDNATRELIFSYIKPLNAPVGPKQTKCIVTATLDQCDLEKAVSVSCSTQTPDVPSGNVFVTKTKYCLSWGPGNSTRLIASCTVEWTGKSWLKGPIEKGANDGQIQYIKDLTAALRAACVKPSTSRAPGKGGAKGKGRNKRAISEAEVATIATAAASAKVKEEANWGLLEPLRGLLEPITSILSPLLSTQVIIVVLMLLLTYSWLFPSRAASARKGGLYLPITSPDRLAAYEEIWRREESELWDWLEDRVGLHDGVPISRNAWNDGSKYGGDRNSQKVLKNMARKAEQENLSERQVDDAIRITEERLHGLKEAVARKKAV